MITRRLLLRQSRCLTIPVQTSRLRSLATDAAALPHENHSVDLFELVKEGAISKNVATYIANQKRHDLTSEFSSHQTTPGFTLPSSISEVTLESLLACQSHLGHSKSLWNPANARYIMGIRNGIHIISLDQTAAHLRRAAKVVKAVAARAGLILFAGTRKGQERSIVDAATRAEGYHLFDRWVPGSLTNGQNILGHAQLKVVDQLDREIVGFEEQLHEYKACMPDLVVCLNPLENYPLLHECAINNIPTIGIIDTNANPAWVTYQIPANDDSLRCTSLIAHVLSIAAKEGRAERLDTAKAGQIPFEVDHRLVLPEDFDASLEKDTEDLVDLRPDRGATSVRFANPEHNKPTQQ